MEDQQHDTELDNFGGEPLDGSGFKGEQPRSEDEIVLATLSDEHKGGSIVSSPAPSNQTQNPEQQKRDHRQEVTDLIINLLEQGVAPGRSRGRASEFR